MSHEKTNMKELMFVRVNNLAVPLACLLTIATSTATGETTMFGAISTIKCGNIIDGTSPPPLDHEH